MPIQVFVDESGSKGTTNDFVMVGVAAHSLGWLQFSAQWQECLDTDPAIAYFKMSEAAKLDKCFRRFSNEQRDQKIRDLLEIINRWVSRIVYAGYDLVAHEKIWGHLTKPFNHPYFLAFQTIILGSAYELYDAGIRQPFEIIFDEEVMFGPHAKAWYPTIREVTRENYYDSFNIMPVEPIFRKDHECLPLQASDLFAYCMREHFNHHERVSTRWVLDQPYSFPPSEHSHYFDEERLRVAADRSNQITATGIPLVEHAAKYKELFGDPS